MLQLAEEQDAKRGKQQLPLNRGVNIACEREGTHEKHSGIRGALGGTWDAWGGEKREESKQYNAYVVLAED